MSQLAGRPVLLAANGASGRHALVVDHALRPLFAFFRALTVPSTVYSKEHRSDCPLAALAVVLDSSGFVRRSGVFAGNASEPATLQDMLGGLVLRPPPIWRPRNFVHRPSVS